MPRRGKTDNGRPAVNITVGTRRHHTNYVPLKTTGEANRRRIEQAIEAFGPDVMVQVMANDMLAGPCTACLDLAKRPVPIARAPLGPLPECPHPDQCVLFFRAVMTWD